MGIAAGKCVDCGATMPAGCRCIVCGGEVVKAKRHKYGAKPVTVGGIRFDSTGEANRWQELLLLEKAGKIECLRRQVRFPLKALGGKIVCHFVADFTYYEGETYVVEDHKGKRGNGKGLLTAVYKLKRAFLFAQYGIIVRES